MDASRAVDDVNIFKNSLKSLQDDRKRDVEETAEFINQLVTQGKLDQQKETSRIAEELEQIRQEIAERVNGNDLLETKEVLVNQLDAKVDLEEVQGALNECQSDIVKQLDEFKDVIQLEIQRAQDDTFKAIDMKADQLDMQQQLD